MNQDIDNEWGYEHLLRQCYSVATFSPDPSTQNGAIILNNTGSTIGVGINRFPHSVEMTEDRWERPKKYSFIEHAERNAIFDAARKGLITKNMTMVCPWAACADCARAIIEIGITRLVTHRLMHDLPALRWSTSIQYGFEMFEEAGVEVMFYEKPVKSAAIRVSGELLTF